MRTVKYNVSCPCGTHEVELPTNEFGYIHIPEWYCPDCNCAVSWTYNIKLKRKECIEEPVCAICNGTGMVIEPHKDSPGCDWEPCPGCNAQEE